MGIFAVDGVIEVAGNKIKDKARIILFDFCKTKSKPLVLCLRRVGWQLRLPWRQIGKIQEYVVDYLELPWQEQEFANLSLEQQRSVFLRILLEAKGRGAIMAGLPMNWRVVLGNRAPIAVADGRDLAIAGVFGRLEAALGEVFGKQISIIGIEESWQQKVVDKVLASGGKPILTGSLGKKMSQQYFSELGIAIPVLKASKAMNLADGVILLSGIMARQADPKIFSFKEVKIALAGEWLPPFEKGIFACGLAAAILEFGGEVKTSPFKAGSLSNFADIPKAD